MNKLWLLFLPFLFVSCATITRGTHDKLYVQSEPSGAEVTLSTGEKGVTPAKFIRSRRESLTVTVSKPGYNTQIVHVESKASPTGGTAMIGGNLVAGGLVGVGVDAASGAMLSLYPNPVVVHLKPSAKPSKGTKTSSAHKSEKKTTRREEPKVETAPTPQPKSSPEPEELPPIKSSPAPSSPPTPEASPVLESSPS